MAIVFVSPRKKQIISLLSIAGFFLLALIIISLVVFFAQPGQPASNKTFKKPNLNIDFSLLDSQELKALLPLDQMELQFEYQATDSKGGEVSGKISAISEDVARSKLEASGFKEIKIKKDSAGRVNPFDSYYTPPIIKKTK